MTAQHIQDTVTLSNGVQMPWFGLGVFQSIEGEEVQNAVKWALEAGYRHIDTAALYANERGVGLAIRASGIPRQQIFITTKVWNSDQGYDQTLRAFDESLERLGMDIIDLFRVHWPVKGKYKQTWRALETIYRQGRARAIGVSNFLVHHLKDLLDSAEIAPMIDQVEFHPRLQQPELQAFCKANRIQLEAWAPILKGRVLEIPELVAIGDKYGKSAIQVTLRWELQLGLITIPKSVHKDRIVSNAQIFDFELSQQDIAEIERLDRHQRVGADPDHFNF